MVIGIKSLEEKISFQQNEQPMSDSSATDELKADHLEFAWKTHEYLHEYIRFADTKAAFVVAWCSALIGMLYVGQLHQAVLDSYFTFHNISLSVTLAAIGFPLLGGAFVIAA
jgi:hypothetical protein